MSNTPAHTLNITELLRDGRHFAEKRGDRVHIVDSLTGNTHVLFTDAQDGKQPTKFLEYVAPNGVKTWIEEGVELAVTGGRMVVAFSPQIISIICQKIAEGAAITEICKEEGMPRYAQLRLWARQHPWIDKEFDQARRDRAETMRDKALTTAETAVAKDPGFAASLKIDTYKWAAGVDHEKYNPKTKVEATLNTPTQIVVFTGIDRTAQEREVRAVEGSSTAEGTIPTVLQKYEE